MSDAPPRRLPGKTTMITVTCALLTLATFLHFRDDAAPPENPFPAPLRDPAAENRLRDAAEDFHRTVPGISAMALDPYETNLSESRLVMLGFAPALRDARAYAAQLPAARTLLTERTLALPPPDAAHLFDSQTGSALKIATQSLVYAALLAHRDGRPEEAVALLETYGPHRWDTSRGSITFIQALTLTACRNLEHDAAVQLAYADADPARVRRLLTVVEADRPATGLFRRTLQGEFEFVRHCATPGPFGIKPLEECLRALAQSDSPAVLGKNIQATWFAANTLPNATRRWLAEQLIAADRPESEPIPAPATGRFARTLGRNCGGVRLAESGAIVYPLIREKIGRQATARHTLARTAIALRLDELTHAKRPNTLAALTPEFLPAAPSDPYDGRPVRYDAARGRLWCLGKDLKDDGGVEGADVVLHLPGCEPPDAESVFDQEKRRGAAATAGNTTP